MNQFPSGRQHVIGYEQQRATVVEVGGGIREYSEVGRHVLHPYDVEQVCDGAHGMPLIPWPNRLADGRFSFDGQEHQLPLSEPGSSNAIHGLLRWRPWQAVRHEHDRVTMAASLFPMDGFPFRLDVTVDYRLDANGLTVTTSATNCGKRPCPYGCGQHPYLSPGEGTIDDCRLQFGAEQRISTDDRQLPAGTTRVAGTQFDFSDGPLLGRTEVDFAFTGLARDDSQLCWVRLLGPDGRCAQLWADGSYPYMELFTADTLAAGRRRRGLGTEPMSCPPNALQSGVDLIRLEPGQSTTHRWGASLA